MSEIHLLKPLSISDSREHQSAERSKPARYQLFANELYYAYGGFRGKRSFPLKLLYSSPQEWGVRGIDMPQGIIFIKNPPPVFL